MAVDRRAFIGGATALAGLGIAGFPGVSKARTSTGAPDATVIVDAVSGKPLHRSGASGARFTPCSTFKIPLALIGFDSGILKDAHSPAWDYQPAIHHANRAEEKQRTDPTTWESNSVVWYSQEITRRLGEARFKDYVDRLGYGNRDVSGNPGKHDGLTQAWLGSSLAISPDEQVAFVRRMLTRQFPVSAEAYRLAESVIPVFEGSGGWVVHGKTGSGSLGGDESRPIGWFAGWADKGKRRVAFAKMGAGIGMTMLKKLQSEIGALAG